MSAPARIRPPLAGFDPPYGDSATASQLKGTDGAAQAGKSLLYVANDALWLLPSVASRPVRVAAPLFTPSDWQNFFGEISWSDQFAWRSSD